MFLWFFSEKSIFANFHVYFQNIQFCEGAHKGSPYLYTGSKYRGTKRSVYKIQGGGCNNPYPSEDVLQKTSGGQGLTYTDEFHASSKYED